MRAIVQDGYGSADTLRLAALPTPAIDRDEVLVRVAAAGVDRGAYHLMRGEPYLVRLMGFGLRAPKSMVPGRNFAGRVEGVGGDVRRFRPGDEVYGTCDGSFAEFASVREDRMAPRPSGLSCEEAAVLPYSGAASLQAICDHARVERRQSVLIVGASGAVGTVAVQIAKSLGAVVSGVCSAGGAELARHAGADHVIDYATTDFASGDVRYDVIIDVGGNTSVSRLRRALEPEGTLVIVGGEGGGRIIGGVQRLLWARTLSPFVGQTLTTFIASEDGAVLRRLNEFVEAGHVRPVIGESFDLSDAPNAVRALDAGLTRGRIVVTP